MTETFPTRTSNKILTYIPYMEICQNDCPKDGSSEEALNA